MVKPFIKGAITLVFLVGVNIGLGYVTDIKFVDFMFVVGLIMTLVIMFFTSSGGYTTEAAEVYTKGEAGRQKFKFSANVPFWVSLVYTLIGLLAFVYVILMYL